jgi:lysophospholipase L1-like esterase
MKISIYVLLILILSFTMLSFQGERGIVPDPDPARFQSEIELFKEWDQKNSHPAEAVLFIGSSSIRMWPTRQAFPEYPVINRGFGGAQTSDVVHFYDVVVRPYDARIILLYAGDNDIADGKNAPQVFEDYIELVNRIMQDKPAVKFVYLPIKPSPSRFAKWEEMKRLNLMIKEYNQKNPRLFYLDTASALLDSVGVPEKKYFIEDLLHLNETGYAVWQKILAPQLKELYDK